MTVPPTGSATSGQNNSASTAATAAQSATVNYNQFLQLRPGDVGRAQQMRAGAVLRRLGFVKYRHREGLSLEWRYRRPDQE